MPKSQETQSQSPASRNVGETAATSFWLRLDPKFIDDNVDRFVRYLKDSVYAKDSRPPLFSESLRLLDERCDEFVSALHTSIPGTVFDDLSRIGFRLIPAQVLLNRETDPERAKERFCVFLEILALLVPGMAAKMASLCRDVVCAKTVSSYGFGWHNLVGDDSPAVVAQVVLNGTKLSDSLPGRWLQGRGTVHVSPEGIHIWPVNKYEVEEEPDGKSSFRCLGDIHVMTPAAEALRNGAASAPDTLKRFYSSFLRVARTMKPSPVAELKQFANNDEVAVRRTGVTARGDILVETVDGRHEKVTGCIRHDMPIIRTYSTSDLVRHLSPAAVFPATIDSLKTGRFHVLTTLNRFIIDNVYRPGKVKAICTKVVSGKNLFWFTEEGYPVSTAYMEGISIGTVAVLNVLSWTDEGNVKCHIVGLLDEPFDQELARRNLLIRFVASADGMWTEPDPDDEFRTPEQVDALARLLLQTAKETGSLQERIGMLFCSAFLLEAAGDDNGFTTALLHIRHIGNLSRFAKDKQDAIDLGFYKETSALCPEALRLGSIATLLKAYGSDADLPVLPEGSLAWKEVVALHDIVCAVRLLRDIADEQTLADIRMKACGVVGISSSDVYDTSSVCIGHESGTQEQKTSFVFAPKNAYEQNQEKTIFKVIASFLNSETGGSLYLGVNDYGYVNGLEEDIKYVERKLPANKGMDGYLRYLRLRLETAFPREVYTTLSIEPVFDDRAVAIHVPAYPYGVVDLDGVSWIRFGPECIRMSDALRERIDGKRRKTTTAQ